MATKEKGGTVISVPHLAESLVSATIGKWLKRPGDYVEEYDLLCELMTNKVNVEMPSPVEGELVDILVEEGQEADVGAPICIIREPNRSAVDEERPAAAEAIAPSGQVSADHTIQAEAGRGLVEQKMRYSPAVLHLAGEHQVDLRQVKGTGMNGRITRIDVLNYLEERRKAEGERRRESRIRQDALAEAENASSPEVSDAFVQPVASGSSLPTPQPAASDKVLPLTPIRRTIAARMKQSVSEIPHAWMMIEADVSGLVSLRHKWKEEFWRKEGVKLTYFPFVLKAVVAAIKQVPMMNSVWAEDKIIVKKDIHLSVAVGSEDSVVTPVIKHADRKSVAGLALELDDLVTRSRKGRLTLSDLEGGTFTVNNTGAFGTVLTCPIINYPQAALMTVESIVRRPVVVDEMIAVRSVANLCLSLDHRILDGMICGKFMQQVKRNLESYDLDSPIY
ncbi:branched-chain alpha-keto acid dehydrogenase subunit E2 [Paenibacillus sp. A3]|uniref:dihydrolipoamide acetyltransferase family protein n=1 Tax=Paenibacillus sp. A3 TaxID=1337054 RepID=UPI0006D5B480|nr:dihydrolipoamide acetyltransferase family protein [Paenibacillus sp. A3]KPV58673.1 branched-chain alpha-keto acid dehydrogenase subunit E2 [Paenibacillus sp. A3]